MGNTADLNHELLRLGIPPSVKNKFKEKIMKPKIQLLSQGEIELIHNRSLDLLKSKGVRYQSERALHYLKEAGQEVNYDTLTVKISPGLDPPPN